jgi:hypothetical protein
MWTATTILVSFVRHATEQELVRPQHAALMMVENSLKALLRRFTS